MLWADNTSDDYSPVAHRHHPPDPKNTTTEKKHAKKRKLQNMKYMDDDEKRKSFLERNRQAALKCRQRKKQWLNNLQAKVEYLTNDNEQLQMQSNLMREEVMQLRNMLWAHNKQCHLNKRPDIMMDNLIHPMMTPDSPTHDYLSPTTSSTLF